MAADDDSADLRRQFESVISGAELDDLRLLSGAEQLWGQPSASPPKPARPDLRHPRRPNAVRYRIRVDLESAQPPIWRRLNLRSDLTLDVVHQALQTAYEWEDRHLHRFSLGGQVFDPTSQWFLCPDDVESRETEDEGLPASEVRLDEALHKRGDVLHYLYDYGDSWELTLRLEEVLPEDPTMPAVVALAGRRAAPPEDCGGVTNVLHLSSLIFDPAYFDLDELNTALLSAPFALRERGVDGRLIELTKRLRFTPLGHDLARRMALFSEDPGSLPREEMVAALAAYQWFLDRADNGGIPLTAAGYLRPVDVQAAAQVVPTMADWLGYRKNNRERHTLPVLSFRQSLQAMGLLRKSKGALLLTRAGVKARQDPEALWRHIATRLIPNRPDSFEEMGTLLLLAYAASTEAYESPPFHLISMALTDLGWRSADSLVVDLASVRRLEAWTTLANVTDRALKIFEDPFVSPAAAALARSALHPN